MPRLLAHAVRLPLAAVAVLAAAAAQAPTPRGDVLPRAALTARSLAGVGEFGGALTAVGRSWRATFGERGVTFEPALGREAPAAHELTFATRGITRGDRTVLDTSAATPSRHHDRTSVRFEWPAVTERFVAEASGLKQTYVFAERPAGRGDLVVQILVHGTLPQAHTADGLRWTDERGNGVRLGDVIGIDAHGERCRGTARPVDGGIELRLPGAFVERAAYPLELDPLIGTAIQAYQGVDADFPDVAYESWSNTYMVAWTQFFGGGTTGIVASVWLADTLGFGYAFAVNQPGDEDSVRVTSIGGTGLFVLVWVNRSGNTSSICGLGVEPVQAQGTAVFPIDGPAGVESPVVSGEATASDDDCLVAWLDDTFGLLGCSVTIDLQFQVSATPIVQVVGGAVREPAFSKQGGAAGLHLLTWIDRPIGQPGWLRAQVIDHDFNQLGPGAWIQNSPQNCGFPAVDGDGFRFLVAWEEQEVANPAASDIRGRIVTVGPAGITSLGGVLDLAAVANDIDFACDVALLGDRFGLCFTVADAAAPSFDDCYVRTLAADGSPIGAEHRLDVTLGTNYRYEHAPRLIGRRDGNPQTNADDGLVVFADQNVVTFDSDVGLQAVEALGPGGPITDLGGGCGPGGLAGSTGPFALGNPAAPLQLFGAQPPAVPFVLLGLPNTRLNCGVCTAVDALASWFVPNTAGTAATTFVIPGDPAVLGFQFDFQFVSFNVLYVGCPLLPGLALSNIVRATVGN